MIGAPYQWIKPCLSSRLRPTSRKLGRADAAGDALPEVPIAWETTLLLHYCLGVPRESRIIGICEPSCRSINITSRRSIWKKTAVFLPGITLLKSEVYLSRNSATD